MSIEMNGRFSIKARKSEKVKSDLIIDQRILIDLQGQLAYERTKDTYHACQSVRQHEKESQLTWGGEGLMRVESVSAYCESDVGKRNEE